MIKPPGGAASEPCSPKSLLQAQERGSHNLRIRRSTLLFHRVFSPLIVDAGLHVCGYDRRTSATCSDIEMQFRCEYPEKHQVIECERKELSSRALGHALRLRAAVPRSFMQRSRRRNNHCKTRLLLGRCLATFQKRQDHRRGGLCTLRPLDDFHVRAVSRAGRALGSQRSVRRGDTRGLVPRARFRAATS